MPPTRMFSKNLNINPFNNVVVSSFSLRKHHKVLSPNFPALVLSPITPLIPDPFNRSRSVSKNGVVVVMDTAEADEEKAMKEKRFFLHPSPASISCDIKPCLLPLFPTTTTATASPGSGSSINFY
ncbi:VQ motif-containing protein 4 [Glycine soja]